MPKHANFTWRDVWKKIFHNPPQTWQLLSKTAKSLTRMVSFNGGDWQLVVCGHLHHHAIVELFHFFSSHIDIFPSIYSFYILLHLFILIWLARAWFCLVRGLILSARSLFGICELKSIKNVHYRCVVYFVWMQLARQPKWLRSEYHSKDQSETEEQQHRE